MEPEHHVKPEGGYVLLTPGRILRAWELHHAKIITLLDLRVWLACHELVARRLGPQNRARANYTLDELATLTNSTRVAASIRRLERSGLLSWSPRTITFSDAAPEHSYTESVSLRRLVPVPRRLLRALAAGVPRSTLATVLALLLRCAFIRRGVCSWHGRCKSSWVAETFGIHQRSVKRARGWLRAEGWLEATESPAWVRNRWGGAVVVRGDLAQPQRRSDRQSHPPTDRRLSPRRATRAPHLSPPDSHKHPLRAYNHQNPADGGLPGSWRNAKNPHGEPTLHDVQRADLLEPDRTLALHHQACERGLADRSEAGRLRFVALAMHARRCGTRNPGGLLAWLLQGQRWAFATQFDEDQARKHLHRERRQRERGDPNPSQTHLAPIGFVAATLLGLYNPCSERSSADVPSHQAVR